jgi:hypothetical protein
VDVTWGPRGFSHRKIVHVFPSLFYNWQLLFFASFI